MYKLQFTPNTKSYIPKHNKAQKCKVNPISVFAEGNTISFIDGRFHFI